ncbi:diguanylate cyclase [Thiomicrorhabdus aquaedulcis]|uniref:sensor domain-containing diguanylate cyclase n=1 Tax=Thiomicrorhabdus aquaedulcis TaxID=2211106 RepID=UPI000FDB08D7|nr:sensor domain-containing diguanylate cyclase [Thiomicrorhabdus aquaedulcis]
MSINTPSTTLYNRFPTLLIISDQMNRNLSFSNEFSNTLLGYTPAEVITKSITDILSNGSIIFLETYIEPLLKEHGECLEVQLTFKHKQGLRVPCVANISLLENHLFWAIQATQKRDKLYQELINTRDTLELLTEKLRLAARTDPLTQLLNRRAAIYDLNKLMEQNKRRFVPLTFLLIDVDFFKKINDELGHTGGDEILKKLSTILQKVCRSIDIVARWGGEEFLIVLYNSERSQTAIFCERLHEQVQQIHIQNQSVTISIGIAQTNSSENLIDEMIRLADIALYLAKNNGRNRSEFFSPKPT